MKPCRTNICNLKVRMIHVWLLDLFVILLIDIFDYKSVLHGYKVHCYESDVVRCRTICYSGVLPRLKG